MAYTTAAKTDKPTDWKALWISFGDVALTKKNDSHGSDLAFNRSSRRGECGLSNDGTCFWFAIFRLGCCGEDDWVVDVAEIPVPTVFEKLFFESGVGWLLLFSPLFSHPQLLSCNAFSRSVRRLLQTPQYRIGTPSSIQDWHALLLDKEPWFDSSTVSSLAAAG